LGCSEGVYKINLKQGKILKHECITNRRIGVSPVRMILFINIFCLSPTIYQKGESRLFFVKTDTTILVF
jgi:hypothetical protein